MTSLYSIGNFDNDYYYVDDSTNEEKTITLDEYNSYSSSLVYPKLKKISDLGL